MATYKTFAIAGASGNLGKYILGAFDAAGHTHQVTILTRKSTGSNAFADEWKQKGAKIAAVDYAVEQDLVDALTGVDVVISAVGQTGMGTEVPLAQAGKKAGIKLFVSGHWGSPIDGSEHPALAPLKYRDASLRVAEGLGLPWTQFRVGGFADVIPYFPALGLTELKDRKATLWGDGKPQESWTTQADIARYVVYVLTHLPPSKFNNRTFNIQADLKSFNEIVHLYEANHPGPPVDITYKPLSELEARANAGGHAALIDALILVLSTGKGKHDQSTLDNGEYPDWNPKGLADIL